MTVKGRLKSPMTLPAPFPDPDRADAGAHWHEQRGDSAIVDGILDRLIHNAYGIEPKVRIPARETKQAPCGVAQ